MADPMEIARGLTKAQRNAVAWFDGRQATSWFRYRDPSLVTRKRLLASGLLGTVERTDPRIRLPVVAWKLTDLGREVAAALREAETP